MANDKPKNKGGRPTVFTPEKIKEIFDLIIQGESERSIFDKPGMPNWRTWCYFKMDADDELIHRYARAKESGLQAWEQKIIDISEDSSRDFQPDGKGGVKSDNTAVNRDRLRVDSRKWLMSKMLPKVYSDKVQQEITGKDGAALIPEISVTIKPAKA